MVLFGDGIKYTNISRELQTDQTGNLTLGGVVMLFDMRCHHRDRGKMGSTLFKVVAVGALIYVGAKAMQMMNE